MYTIEQDGQWCWFANTIASFKSEDSFSQCGSRLEFASERKGARSEEGREGEIIAIFSPRRRWQSDMASKFLHKLPLRGYAEGAVPSLSTNSLHSHSGKMQCFLRLSHRQSVASPSLSHLPFPGQPRGVVITQIHRERLSLAGSAGTLEGKDTEMWG